MCAIILKFIVLFRCRDLCAIMLSAIMLSVKILRVVCWYADLITYLSRWSILLSRSINYHLCIVELLLLRKKSSLLLISTFKNTQTLQLLTANIKSNIIYKSFYKSKLCDLGWESLSREVLQKRMVQYSWPPCTN